MLSKRSVYATLIALALVPSTLAAPAFAKDHHDKHHKHHGDHYRDDHHRDSRQ